MPGRKYDNGSGYRYGFNGKEDDKDISGGGQDYGMRIYDARLGRFLSVDPLTEDYPELTTYQFSNNSPTANIDLDGLENYYYKLKLDEQTGIASLTLTKVEDRIDEITNDIWSLTSNGNAYISSTYTTTFKNRWQNYIVEYSWDRLIYTEAVCFMHTETVSQEYNDDPTKKDIGEVAGDLEDKAEEESNWDDFRQGFAGGLANHIGSGGSKRIRFHTAEPTEGLNARAISVHSGNPGSVTESTSNSGSSKIKSVGRSGQQAKLRSILKDKNASAADKGWVTQEINRINAGKSKNIRIHPGKVLAHERGREAAKGYSYKYTNLQLQKLHNLQHKYDNNGKRNKERPVKS